jgi:uncharacterized protein (TIGR02466 family)
VKHILFNSYIWKSKINYDKKDELIKNLTNDYYENKNKLTPRWNSLSYSSFTERRNDKIPEDLIDLIEDKMLEFLKDFSTELKIKEEYILHNIWYNIYGKNNYQEPHIHAPSLFSGCYYLKLNKDIHYQTTFYNPNFDVDYLKVKENPYFSFTPDCEEDDIIIFPSCLKHGTKGVKKNFSNDLRMTISFNVTNPNVCIDNHQNQTKKMPYMYG